MIRNILPPSKRTIASPARKASTLSWISTSSMRSSCPPARPPGASTWWTATMPSAAARNLLRWPATRPSPYPPATPSACPLASPSWAALSANPRSSDWPTPSSRPHARAARHSTCQRSCKLSLTDSTVKNTDIDRLNDTCKSRECMLKEAMYGRRRTHIALWKQVSFKGRCLAGSHFDRSNAHNAHISAPCSAGSGSFCRSMVVSRSYPADLGLCPEPAPPPVLRNHAFQSAHQKRMDTAGDSTLLYSGRCAEQQSVSISRPLARPPAGELHARRSLALHPYLTSRQSHVPARSGRECRNAGITGRPAGAHLRNGYQRCFAALSMIPPKMILVALP